MKAIMRYGGGREEQKLISIRKSVVFSACMMNLMIYHEERVVRIVTGFIPRSKLYKEGISDASGTELIQDGFGILVKLLLLYEKYRDGKQVLSNHVLDINMNGLWGSY